jgi:hypothetical protein
MLTNSWFKKETKIALGPQPTGIYPLAQFFYFLLSILRRQDAGVSEDLHQIQTIQTEAEAEGDTQGTGVRL